MPGSQVNRCGFSAKPDLYLSIDNRYKGEPGNITPIEMQQVYIPSERIRKLRKDRKMLDALERICKCTIDVKEEDSIVINAQDGYGEFLARNVLFAFGRGFELLDAEKLLNDEYYFNSIDVGQILGSEKRVKQVKARIIGEDGRTKTYIESVSGAKLSIYGDTVSFIGTPSQVSEAETAVDILIHGGTHKVAYSRMETVHRKNKAERQSVEF